MTVQFLATEYYIYVVQDSGFFTWLLGTYRAVSLSRIPLESYTPLLPENVGSAIKHGRTNIKPLASVSQFFDGYAESAEAPMIPLPSEPFPHDIGVRLISRQRLSPSIYRLRFAPSLGGFYLTTRPGQHFALTANVPGAGSVTRAYSPISMNYEHGYVEFMIKCFADGKLSRHLTQSMRVGGVIQMYGPMGIYHYIPRRHQRLLLIAGGSGLAPLLKIIKCSLENREDQTTMTLLYFCREKPTPLLDELQAYEDASGGLLKTIVFDSARPTDDDAREKILKLSSQTVGEPSTKRPWQWWSDSDREDGSSAKILICGPPMFNGKLVQMLLGKEGSCSPAEVYAFGWSDH
jgi:NAD(P)H-flavin reductase